MKNNKIFIFLLCFLFSQNVTALSISFQILQRDNSDHEIRSSTHLIEENLFNYFFNRGIIISNAPPICSDSQKKDEYLFNQSMEEAREGGVSYFIELLGNYSSASTNPDAILLENILSFEWKVINVKNKKVIGSGKKTPLSKNKNVQKGISDFTQSIADEILKLIRK